MPDITHPVPRDHFRPELEKLAALDWEAAPLIQALLTAIDYDDQELVDAQANALFECLRELAENRIQERLGSAKALQDVWSNLRKVVAGRPAASFDEVGKQLEALFDQRLAGLNTILQGPVAVLQKLGHPVANVEALQVEIAKLQALKQQVFEDWPWTARPLPPVNRDMVARARSALALRPGESTEDMLRRFATFRLFPVEHDRRAR